MLRLPGMALPKTAASKLVGLQAAVDREPSYAARVAKAKASFAKKPDTTFATIRQTLKQMCQGLVRCSYCEDSMGDEVEHLRPKNLYPEQVFLWDNYIFACGPCNRLKLDKFAVIDAQGRLVDVSRPRGAPVLPPVTGRWALIDPRTEDPLAFLELDLLGTFYFNLIPAPAAPDWQRARFTCDLVGLNRDPLPRARRAAYVANTTLLSRYLERQLAQAPAAELNAIRQAILDQPHPTVWREMQRQQSLHPHLAALFQAVPAALTW